MSKDSQSSNAVIWGAIIAAIGTIVVALIGLNAPSNGGSSSGSPTDGSSTNSVCVESEISTQGDNAPVNCSN